MVYHKDQSWVPCFFIYINDLPNISKKLKFYLFADDTNIYLESHDLQSLEKVMNTELEMLFEWLCINRLSLNISKTNFIIFCPINKPKIPVTILINKEAIDETKQVKYLGILIDSQLTFKQHIGELNNKIARAIGILYKISPFVSTSILLNIYHAIIYPLLLYGVSVWGNAYKTLLEPVYIMQKTFVRMATYNDSYPATSGPLVHTPPLFHKLKVLTIFNIYKLQLGKLIYESINDVGPTNKVIMYTRASEDLKDYKHKVNIYGKYYQTKAKTVEQKNPSLEILNDTLSPHTYNNN